MAVLYILAVNPFRVKSIKKVEMIENILSRLERYERKGGKVRNEKWIKAEEAKLEVIKKVRLEYEVFYKERDRYLEKFFASVNEEDIKDEALWKNMYIQGVNGLLSKLRRHNILLGKNALPFKEWKAEIPTWEDIVPEQKRFWIIDKLINMVLKKELKVIYLESINFGEKGFSPANTNDYAELCDIIPFTVKVSMDVEGLLLFLNEFLKSKMCFEIETVSMHRELERLRTPDGAERSYQHVQKRNIQPSSVVEVIIKAYALDFKI